MANPNGRKGATAERAVADYLAEIFPYADRRVKTGAKDKGDIGGVPAVVEVKNVATLNLSGWLKEAHVERDNAGENLGIVWHKRIGKGHPRDWYVTMDGATARLMLHAVEYMRNAEVEKIADVLRAKKGNA